MATNLNNLNRIKGLQGLIKFREGANLTAGQLNANFELLSNASGDILENINIILNEFDDVQKVIAKDDNRAFSITDVELLHPLLLLGVLRVNPNVNIDLNKAYLGFEIIGGNNSPVSEFVWIQFQTTQKTGDLIETGNFNIRNNGETQNWRAFYTFNENEDGTQFYEIYISPKELDGETGVYEWTTPDTVIYENLSYFSNNISFELNGEPRETTYNIIDWTLGINPDTDPSFKEAESLTIDFENTIEIINDFVENYQDVLITIEGLTNLIGTEPDLETGAPETVIYGTDYTDFEAGKEPIIRQDTVDIGFADIQNDTTLTGTNGKEVIENLEARVIVNENKNITFADGTNLETQEKAINNAQDLSYQINETSPAVQIKDAETVQEAINELDVKTLARDAVIDTNVTINTSRIDLLEENVSMLTEGGEINATFADGIKVPEVKWSDKANTNTVNSLITATQDLIAAQTAQETYEFRGDALTTGTITEGTWTQIGWTEKFNSYPMLSFTTPTFTITESLPPVSITISGQTDNSGQSKDISIRMLKDGVQLGNINTQTVSKSGNIRYDGDFETLEPGNYTFEIQSSTGGGTITFLSGFIKFLSIGASTGSTLSPIFADGISVESVNWGDKADITYVEAQDVALQAQIDAQDTLKVDKVTTGTSTSGISYTSTVDNAVIGQTNYAGTQFIRIENSTGFGFGVDSLLEDDGGGARLIYLPDDGTEIEIISDMTIPHKKYVDDKFKYTNEGGSQIASGYIAWRDTGTDGVALRVQSNIKNASGVEEYVDLVRITPDGTMTVGAGTYSISSYNPAFSDDIKFLKDKIDILEAEIKNLKDKTYV